MVMTVFEPLFLLLVLVSAVTLATALVTRRGRIALRWMTCAGVYFGIVMAVSLVADRKVYEVGDAQCFDDWCITVAEAGRETPGAPYDVSLRLSSRAKRVPMGEKGTVVYLTDSEGRRYDPLPDPAYIPLDTVLQPGESVVAKRRFGVPSEARGVGLIYAHEGGFPIGWFIIGEGGWFAKPPIVMLR